MIETFQTLKHKADWETPRSLLNWIEEVSGISPKIDACATKYNRKCPKFITPKKDLFKTELKEDFFCNPPYARGQVDKFVEYCHDQSVKNKVNGVCLLFANTCSSRYWSKHIGNTPSQMRKNNVELYFPNHRIHFEVNHKPVGAPALASVVVVWRNDRMDGFA